MTKTHTYLSEEAKNGFLALSESDQRTLKMIHETEAHALNDVMNSRVDALIKPSESITIAEVCLESSDFGAPTPEEIEKLGLVELKDGDEANAKVPQYGVHIISDYDEFKRAFPHYAHLKRKEAEAKNLFPYIYCGYNKLARNLMLAHRNKREPNDAEWKKLKEYAKENGNNTLIQAMNAWFVGYRGADGRKFGGVGDWADFGVSDGSADGGMPYVWFNRDGTGMGRYSTSPGHLMVVRAVLENRA